MSGQHRDRIVAFSHIPKTGGQTLVYLLRKNFGAGHIIVRRRSKPTLYRRRDLETDLHLNPWIRSLSGHPLKPYEDFGELDDRLVWITLLRDPVKRFISHYQHQYDRGKEFHKLDFRQWMATFNRGNWMVRMMAEEEDLDAAKHVLSEKFSCVGFMEKYNESLLLIRRRLALTHFDVTYGVPKNVAVKKKVARSVSGKFEEFREAVIEQNQLDIALYEWAMETIWPRQVREYGEAALERHTKDQFVSESLSLTNRVSLASNYLHRNLYYKPLVRLDRHLRRYSS